jgi:hypothetical protein
MRLCLFMNTLAIFRQSEVLPHTNEGVIKRRELVPAAIAPVIPFVTEPELEQILAAAAEAGAVSAGYLAIPAVSDRAET